MALECRKSGSEDLYLALKHSASLTPMIAAVLVIVSLLISRPVSAQTSSTRISQPSSNAGSQNEPDFNPAHIARTYTAHSGTQLHEILKQFQASFLVPIDFEEVAYESSAELVSRDVVAPRGPKHFSFPPRKDFLFTLTSNEIRPMDAVQQLLSAYQAAGLSGAGAYQAVQQPNRIEVLPFQVLGSNGSMQPVKPVTSYKMTFSKQTRSIEETFDLMVTQLSHASGHQVILAQQPFNPSLNIEIGANAETPGDFVERLATQLNTALSFHVRFFDGSYYVTIYPAVDQKIYGNLKNNRAPGPVPSPSSRPNGYTLVKPVKSNAQQAQPPQ